MVFLVDENLPRKLARHLENRYPGSRHVADLDMLMSPDGAVWKKAKSEGFTILSKDRDFADRVVLEGPPPKVVWLRIGNCTTEDLIRFVDSETHQLEQFESSETAGLLVLPPGFEA